MHFSILCLLFIQGNNVQEGNLFAFGSRTAYKVFNSSHLPAAYQERTVGLGSAKKALKSAKTLSANKYDCYSCYPLSGAQAATPPATPRSLALLCFF